MSGQRRIEEWVIVFSISCSFHYNYMYRGGALRTVSLGPGGKGSSVFSNDVMARPILRRAFEMPQVQGRSSSSPLLSPLHSIPDSSPSSYSRAKSAVSKWCRGRRVAGRRVGEEGVSTGLSLISPSRTSTHTLRGFQQINKRDSNIQVKYMLGKLFKL